jgi:hypothetical protein
VANLSFSAACLGLWLWATVVAGQPATTHPAQDAPELYMSFFFFQEDFKLVSTTYGKNMKRMDTRNLS